MINDVTDIKVPYEILIRFDEKGVMYGAHYIERRVVTLDGEVLKDAVMPPIPIKLSENGEVMSGTPEIAKTLNDVLGTTLAYMIAAEGGKLE